VVQVTEVANGLDEERIMELLMQFKFYVHAMPDQARYLLLQNPQLSFLLVQAALRIGLLDKSQADVCLVVMATHVQCHGTARLLPAFSTKPAFFSPMKQACFLFLLKGCSVLGAVFGLGSLYARFLSCARP
jgi:hypothetical protein